MRHFSLHNYKSDFNGKLKNNVRILQIYVSDRYKRDEDLQLTLDFTQYINIDRFGIALSSNKEHDEIISHHQSMIDFKFKRRTSTAVISITLFLVMFIGNIASTHFAEKGYAQEEKTYASM